jgi:hypothetical protein
MAFNGFSLNRTRDNFLREENLDTQLSPGHSFSTVGIRTNYRLKSNSNLSELGIKLEKNVPALQEGVKDRGIL